MKKINKKIKTPKNNNRPRSKGKVTGFEYFKCNRGFVENGSDLEGCDERYKEEEGEDS